MQKYTDAARAALPAGTQFEPVPSFATHPLLVQAFAERLLDAQPQAHEEIVFTAHSLPVRVLEGGDPYAGEVAATARDVAARAGVAEYSVAYQSAGRTPEPWVGPDLSDLIVERARTGRHQFLAVPIGFVCDHTEILFDIDVQAAAAARSCGATLRRTESLNTSPTFIAMLEDLGARGPMNRDPLEADAIVIGGGIAGLSVAYELQRQNIPFVVLERSGRAGGVILSEDIDGYTIDAGPDALLVQKPDGIKLCEELGLGAELVPTLPPRLAYVQRGMRLHPLPAAAVLGIPTRVGPFLATKLFSWQGKARMAAELFVPPRRDGVDESIAGFMTGGSARKRQPTLPNRSWPGSMPATSAVCRCGRCFRASSKSKPLTAVFCASSAGASPVPCRSTARFDRCRGG